VAMSSLGWGHSVCCVVVEGWARCGRAIIRAPLGGHCHPVCSCVGIVGPGVSCVLVVEWAPMVLWWVGKCG